MISVLSDSVLPPGFEQEATQLPCPPEELVRTNVAIETLQKLDEHDKAVQEQVPSHVN